MIEAVEAATGFILFAVLAVALYHQWRRGKSLQAQLAAAEAALEQLQRACSRLAPAGVVQRLVADGIQSNTGLVAERKVATAMFVDLVGFSAMSERLDPELLLRVINGYYQRMSDAIDEHRGQVGSFVGDGIVAYFGAIQPNPWECDDAVRAALAMRAAIREYNVELEHEGLPPISIGIGYRSRAGPSWALRFPRAEGVRVHRTLGQSCSAHTDPDAHSPSGHPCQRGVARRACPRVHSRAHARGSSQGVRRVGRHLRCAGRSADLKPAHQG